MTLKYQLDTSPHAPIFDERADPDQCTYCPKPMVERGGVPYLEYTTHAEWGGAQVEWGRVMAPEPSCDDCLDRRLANLRRCATNAHLSRKTADWIVAWSRAEAEGPA